MENYFNYFTEIEERFLHRRSGGLLLSTLDWALIQTWKDAGIPLEAVLRGIDASFEKWRSRPARARVHMVNSLAYCAPWLRTTQPMSPGRGSRRIASLDVCAAPIRSSIAAIAPVRRC